MPKLQLKTTETIRDDFLSGVLANTRTSDKNLGASLRTLAHALGIELEEMFFKLFRGVRGSYLKDAVGTALDSWAANFGLTRIPATKAIGFVTFTGTPATSIPSGTRVSAPPTTGTEEINFVTTALGTIPGGGSVDVAVEAVTAGVEGNVASNKILRLKDVISGVSSISNTGPTQLGTALEGDDELRERILTLQGSLTRGTPMSILGACIDFQLQEATVYGGITSGATAIPVYEDLTTKPFSGQSGTFLSLGGGTEIVTYTGINTSSFPHQFTGVTRGVIGVATAHADGAEVKDYVTTGAATTITEAIMIEGFGMGTVTAYIDDGSTSGVDSYLEDIVEKRLQGDGTARDPGYRGGGISLYALAAVVDSINVSATIDVHPDHDPTQTKAVAQVAITRFINGLKMGQDVVGYQVAEALMNVAGVENVSGLIIDGTTFTGTPTADVSISSVTVARAGTVTVS